VEPPAGRVEARLDGGDRNVKKAADIGHRVRADVEQGHDHPLMLGQRRDRAAHLLRQFALLDQVGQVALRRRNIYRALQRNDGHTISTPDAIDLFEQNAPKPGGKRLGHA
jgi:hypothetical protein